MFDESPVHTLTSLPATDLNFTSCLQRATDNQIRLALETMQNRDGKDKVLDYIGVGWDPTTIGDNCKGQMSIDDFLK